jgi:hypothetical protein
LWDTFTFTTFEGKWNFIISFVVLDRLDAPGLVSRQRHENVSSPKLPRPALGPTKFPIQGYGGSFAGLKWPGHEVDHSPPSSTEGKNEWIHTSTPIIRLQGVEGDKFTYTFLWFFTAVTLRF